MTAANLEKRSLLRFAESRPTFRPTNCGSLRRSNPNLRLGPCPRISLPDEREESIER
jgi:hypothetical protein